MAPDSLYGLNRKFRQDLVLLPEIPDGWADAFLDGGADEKEEEFGLQVLAVKESWQAFRREIEDILVQFDGFNQNAYKKNNIPKYLAEMDRACAESHLFPGGLQACFRKFSSGAIRAGTKKKYDPPEHLFFDQCEELLAKEDEIVALYGRLLCALRQRSMKYGFTEARKRMGKRGILSFDDLLILLEEALSGRNGKALAAGIRKKYPAALIDEFQDTDPVQYSIFSSVYRGADKTLLYIIGDPKQAIYSFRGADIFAYKKAIHEIGSHSSLEHNYRSDPGLIAAVNAVFRDIENPFCDEDIPFLPVTPAHLPERDHFAINGVKEPCLHLCIARREENDQGRFFTKPEAERRILCALAGEMSRLLHLGNAGKAIIGGHPLSPRDIAVLVRTNREAQLVKEALAESNIASVLQGTGDLFLSREAWEFERVLEAVADPGDDRKIRSAMATDMLGGTCRSILDLEGDEELWAERAAAFLNYHELWQSQGFIRMARTLLSRENVHCQCLRFADGERRLTNILHLSEVLHQHEKERRPGMGGLIHYLGVKREGSEQTVEEHQLRLESDADRVQIVTVHRSKGLQYPIVFCPFTWGGSRLSVNDFHTFHMPDNDFKPVMDLCSEDRDAHLELARREELAENIRLLYVALTRAKYRSYLYWGKFNKGESSALAWLFHRDPADPSPAGTARRFRQLSNEEFLQDLRPLLEKGEGNIQATFIPAEEKYAIFDQRGTYPSLSGRVFLKDIPAHRGVTSFSAMTMHGFGPEMPDRDFSRQGEESPPREERSIFSFPRGAGAGTFIHDLLEHLDFGDIASRTQEVKNHVLQKTVQYGYAPEWTETILEMLYNAAATPLLAGLPGLVLSKIEARQRLSELEFYFPLDRITKEALAQLLADYGIDDRISEKLDFQEVEGFLRGFIDLVFEYDGRYYLLDWKSNCLGRRAEDYRTELIADVMVRETYTLQYLLYTVALHQYLAIRSAGYRYEKHFGGVFYLFLRGMRPDLGPGYGIYHDLPSKALVYELSRLLAPS